jgi:DNA modification methylase
MKHDTIQSGLLIGDCRDLLPTIPDDSVDLIVTSPPYADQRKHTYGGVTPDEYIEWFLPIAAELKRVLKPSGSFILNIKERVVAGERHTYVLELIIEMKKQGWLWTEEYIWHKKNCYPGKWPNRFRDAWERCLHFTRRKDFAMYQEEEMAPMGNWRHSRLQNLSETDMQRDNSKVMSGFGKKYPTGSDERWRIPQTSCTWPQNAQIEIIAPRSQWNFQPGSSNFSHSPGISYSIHSWGLAQLQ